MPMEMPMAIPIKLIQPKIFTNKFICLKISKFLDIIDNFSFKCFTQNIDRVYWYILMDLPKFSSNNYIMVGSNASIGFPNQSCMVDGYQSSIVGHFKRVNVHGIKCKCTKQKIIDIKRGKYSKNLYISGYKNSVDISSKSNLFNVFIQGNKISLMCEDYTILKDSILQGNNLEVNIRTPGIHKQIKIIDNNKKIII